MKNRNNLLDLMKLILAIGVVLVHFPVQGEAGEFLSSIGTVGVIVFFIISGYSCYKNEETDNSPAIMRRAKRILFLTIIAFFLYLIFTIIDELMMGTFDFWARNYLADPWTYIRLILLGDFEFIHGDHLWFLVGLFYAYLIMYFFEKKKLRKTLMVLLPFLILLRIGMETYTNSFPADWHMSGNALVGALPMLALGYVIHIKEKTLLKLPGEFYIALLVISFFLTYYTVNNYIGVLDISQIFKVSSGFLLFMVCLSYPNLIKKDNLLCAFGRYGSLYIYITHYLIGISLLHICLKVGLDSNFFLSNFLPWIILAVSLAISALLCVYKVKLEPKIKKKKVLQSK